MEELVPASMAVAGVAEGGVAADTTEAFTGACDAEARHVVAEFGSGVAVPWCGSGPKGSVPSEGWPAAVVQKRRGPFPKCHKALVAATERPPAATCSGAGA